MNTRIQELAEQNGFIHAGMTAGERNDALKRFEKCAEVIVRECVRVCNKQTPNWKSAYATAFGYGVEFCISGIKEHFGVDES